MTKRADVEVPVSTGTDGETGAATQDDVGAAVRDLDEDSTDAHSAAPGAAGRRDRPSKWDRPAPPRDWRFFVGSLGRVLLASGILMFGFVGYQLWGTGIETARAQRSLADRFDEQLDERPPPAPESTPATTELPVDEPGAADDPPTTEPGSVTTVEIDDASGTGETESPPTTDLDVAITSAVVDQDIPPITRGTPLARLEIPRIGQDVYVVPGVTVDDLKQGPGHYPDTPLPGQLGNAAIAGHRTTYGQPFFDIDQLEAGDELRVTMLTGDRFVYEVTGIEIVEATDYRVVMTTDPDVAELTLTSCHPKYSARQRIVVHSVLDADRSDPVGRPTFYDLDAGTAPVAQTTIPGDDPVIDLDTAAGTDEPTDDPVDDAGRTATSTPVAIDTTDATEATDATDPAASGLDTADDDVTASNAGVAADPTTEGAGGDDTTPDVAPLDAATSGEPGDEGTGEDSAEATGDGRDGTAADSAAPPAGPTGEDAGDAFARGWFADEAAWSQIALWGAALTLIALAAYRISRRVRHDWVGAMVGVAPFVIALYFFFQNVHRLLPPAI